MKLKLLTMKLKLSKKDQHIFFNELDKPSKPNNALKIAAKQFKKVSKNK